MAYFEMIANLIVKELLEIVIVILSFFLSYASYRAFLDIKKQNPRFVKPAKHIFYGFSFFFISMIFELVDSFWLKSAFDEFQLYTGIVAFTFLLIGFIGLFQEAKNA